MAGTWPRIILLLVVPVAVFAEQSELWGEKGERWSPSSRLPDFSFAGYHFGEETPPFAAAGANVRDFGAKGDGSTDDTAAFQKAMEEAAGKVILVPKGTYVLMDRVTMRGRGTVLRGEDRDGTVLLFPKGLEQLHPAPAMADHGEPTSNWSWAGGMLTIESSRHGSGARVDVAPGARRGGNRIELTGELNLAAKDFVLIEWKDGSDGAFTRYIYRDDPGNALGLLGKPSCRQLAQVLALEGRMLTLNRPLRCDVGETFSCTAIKYDPETVGCGIERLTLKFLSGDYAGHFKELGFNGVAVSRDAAHCWLRELKIVDADSGIFGVGLHGLADGILFQAERRPTKEGMTGHHGIDGGIDCLIQNVIYETKFFHDLSLSGGNVGNVFRKVRGVDVNLDHHRWGPYENLFTNLDLGEGSRVWVSGGGGNRGKHTAAGATFWNLESKASIEPPGEDFGPPQINLVGLKIRGRSSREEEGRWVERGSITPADLYQAQLEKRLAEGRAVFGAGESAPMQEWRTLQGKSLSARFDGLDGDAVYLIPADGRRYRVPLGKLDAASRARAEKLGGGAGGK